MIILCPTWDFSVPHETTLSHMRLLCPMRLTALYHMRQLFPTWYFSVPYVNALSYHMRLLCPIWDCSVPYETTMFHETTLSHIRHCSVPWDCSVPLETSLSHMRLPCPTLDFFNVVWKAQSVHMVLSFWPKFYSLGTRTDWDGTGMGQGWDWDGTGTGIRLEQSAGVKFWGIVKKKTQK